MEDITLPLKEILDKGFPPPDKSKLIKAGTYKYVNAKGSTLHSGSESAQPKTSGLGIGFIFDGPFLPIRNGACYTMHNLMRALANDARVTPTLINCFRGWDETSSYYNQSYGSVFVGPADCYHDTGIITEIFGRFDLKLAQFYNGEILLNMAPWLKRQGVKSILEVQNIEYVLLERLGAQAAEIQKAKYTQAEALKVADHVFCRSEIDKHQAIGLGADPSKVTVYRGGICVSDFKFMPRLSKGNKIVYLGHMYYQPNEDAVNLIVDKIMPKLGPSYSLSVIGNCPPHLIEKYADKAVEFLNGIDDISHELLKYDVAVAPIFAGSGTRLKLLDYLASGLPVITTRLGIEGMDPEIARFMTIEDDIDRYAAEISQICSSPANYVERSNSGRKFVEEKYDWAKCVEPFVDVYTEMTYGGN